MLLFYIRHGDPIYHPDNLTPLGLRQAESVAKRLALFGIEGFERPLCSCIPRHLRYAYRNIELLEQLRSKSISGEVDSSLYQEYLRR